MSPIELFDEARLDEALAAQAAAVRERPDDVAERLLLCALLAFSGDRDTVRRHLDVLSSVAPGLRPYVAEWRELLIADESRHAGDRPAFLIDPPTHVLRRREATERLKSGRTEEMRDLIDAADEAAPWVEGYVDGREFDGWRDADELLGPVIEVFHGGRYYWVPIDQIRRLRLEAEEDLRDRLFRPVMLRLDDGGDREVFLPALYAGTAAHPEEGIRSGAGIDWVERDGLMRGLGSRLYLFGGDELTPTEFRQVEVRRVYDH